MLEQVQSDISEIKSDMRKGFKKNREAIAEIVTVVGQKIDHLEDTIKDMQGVTSQNSYELQLLKSKAQ